ncbi:hypothetical protein [Clostridium kluyveri]|uniref:Uncharacterized protein n=1 Tax=Clostridium kluyveri TaxID=1534 RepID=A0A1L5F9R7_CLOKL|nr:hypothetical protein [Clostridium kluyveri]APM39755.1 hypothetical protein BS101_13935 [Clostridium kluyveri]UZQ50084.1 hypothetical protein OP486_19395 [Clostridium kluyveri]
MEIDYVTIIITVLNFIVLFSIIIVVYKSIRGFKNFINRNKEMNKKIDVILDKLENKEDN